MKTKIKKKSSRPKKYHYEMRFRGNNDIETISAFTSLFPNVLFHYQKYVTDICLCNGVLTMNDTGWKFRIGFDCTDKRFAEIEKFIGTTYGVNIVSERFNYNDWY